MTNFKDGDKINITEVEALFCGKCRHDGTCEVECDFMEELEEFLQGYTEAE